MKSKGHVQSEDSSGEAKRDRTLLHLLEKNEQEENKLISDSISLGISYEDILSTLPVDPGQYECSVRWSAA